MKFLLDHATRKFEHLAETELRPSILIRDREGRFDPKIWSTFAENHLFSVGREAGSLNLQELASVFYTLARTSLDIPLVCTFAAHSVVSRELLLRFGSKEQIAHYLPKIESGSVIAAVCNSESGAGTDLRKIRSECITSASGQSQFTFHKPCVTNGAGSLFFVSAWKKSSGAKPAVSVFIVEKSEALTKDVTHELSGFRTGLTGSVQGNIHDFNVTERELKRNAFEVFRHCFNIERFFIGVIVAGALRGLETEARKTLQLRVGGVSEQWLQDKMVRISSARIKLDAMIESLLAKDLASCSAELGVLKLLVNEDAFEAAAAFLELSGHRALSNSHIAQKLVRDLTALRFFGGTSELQKMSLFAEVMAEGVADGVAPVTPAEKAG